MSQIHRHCVFVLFALIVNPLIGWSHPGHSTTAPGVDEFGPVHYLVEPVHAFPIGMTILVITVLALALRRVFIRRRALALGSVGPIERTVG